MSEVLYHYIHVPVVDMRAAPHQQAEVISQALFSEAVQLLTEWGEWAEIRTQTDQYQGWIKKNTIHQRNTPYLAEGQPAITVQRLAAHLYHTPDTIYGPMLTLPFESRLELVEVMEGNAGRWLFIALPDGRQGFIQRGDVAFNSPLLARSQICDFSLRFLGLPYTWGGRSSFGYDCSGFVQMLYRQMGILLPRDAKDQCVDAAFTKIGFKALSPGDPIYFGFSQDKIRHVGMSLGDGDFIHAVAAVENAPYIRISKLTDAAWNGSGHYPYRTARCYVGT